MVNKPVIPENITVHLGSPTEASKNVTVTFPEYIKNVASNEIYPTWPDASVRANILAEISFALNRVYNEWYTSQGYNFDITSLSAYDQKFVENRSFFESISVIVDDIFNNYIVRGKQVQPLFAQYCSGTGSSTCSDLSQWGSVTLANQGKTPIEILRYYYKDTVNLVYNAKVEDIAISYPGYPLTLGIAGDIVRIIKIQLNRISTNYPAIPKISDMSEFYTVETAKSVRKFQKIFNYPKTGIVDKGTWYKIKSIYNSVKRIASIYSEGISEEEATTLYGKYLKYGDEGEYIRVLNYYLTAIAGLDDDIVFYPGSKRKFDERIRSMVIDFQKKYGLATTGEVNADTWRKIKEVYNNDLKTLPQYALFYKEEFYPGFFLIKGMDGDAVISLQHYLYTICKKFKSIPGIRVTGVFDDLTESSVKKIQKDNDLPINGVVGPVTWYTIIEESKK